MRSFKLTLILCGLMLLVTPTKAQAWWELLDYLSGPGPFFGPRVDFRWCPGATDIGADPADVDKKLGEAARNLRTLFGPAGGARPTSILQDTEARNRMLRSILTSLNSVQDSLTKIDSRFPGISTDVKNFAANVVELQKLLPPVPDVQPPGAATRSQLELPGVFFYSTHAIAAADTALDRIKTGLLSIGATGVLVSFCDPGKVRRFALEGGLSALHSPSDPTWAGGHTIYLNALTGGVSFRPYAANNLDHDYFDIGVIGGVFIFSSAGIDSTFSVPIVTPFVDVHTPTSWAYEKGSKYWLTRFTVRVGFVFLTEGIPASQFNGVGHSDITRVEARRLTATVYYNLWPKLRRRADRLPEALVTGSPQ
jgi:hypothetical protein